ncbi:putative periplasmic serine endoprotease DegP-like precursor [Roseimaritima multifibrata]|uniref:Putative periplasmic serine endoprotease DegP-like n=1 Tax=Roseimaritima multifibrata TaxID=1930274 RepID=A0A517MNV5_9BACT|nr:Do family serine endopeptidase [Roseimaritima multifibrata]QDS96561.1 putative periplasmic serine endoprotease DegP-like precursor [Roseimaritima multifibrata]
MTIQTNPSTSTESNVQPLRVRSKRSSGWRAVALAVPLSFAAAGLIVAASPSSSAKAEPSQSKTTQTVVTPETLRVANSLSEAFRNVASGVLPAVVAIENRQTSPVAQGQMRGGASGNGTDPFNGRNPFEGTPFEDMFKDQFRHDGSSPAQPRSHAPTKLGIGSGVVIDSAGIILTNNHVVAGGGQVMVRTQDGREFEAIEVLTDPQTDIAVVKIKGDGNLVAAPFGDSEATSVGDWVVALGQPFGLESTVTAGIISAKNRGIGITDRENFIQTDAAINPGNSGGPLVNLRGEVIGINTAISSRGGGNNGVGFAVPSKLAGWVSKQLVENGKVQRAYLGVGIQPITHELAKQLGVSARSGVAVTNVFPQTPAQAAGLETGDIIVRFGSEKVTTPQQLQLAVERSPVGETVPVEVIRDGKTVRLEYKATAQPNDFGKQAKAPQVTQPEATELQALGLEVTPLDAQVAKQLGMEDVRGILISGVHNGTPADEAGLAAGMVILQVNRKPVSTVEEFQEQIKADADDSILLLLRSENGSQFVVLKR